MGSRLTVTINPPNGSSGEILSDLVTIRTPGQKSQKGMTFSPTMQTFLPNEHLHWKGRLLGVPWLFTGHHHFILRPTETGTTRIEQSEQFSGILALVLYWIGSNMYETTPRGFGLMNTALKERVEGRSLPELDPALRQRVKSSVKVDG